jgi:hypothetical protein
MTKQNLQWLAGVIDAEGSISIYKQPQKRGKYTIITRKYKMRILTTDDIIIPQVAQLLNKQYHKEPHRNHITVYSCECKELLTQLLPFLYIKQPQAKCLLQIAAIKNGKNEFYTTEEETLWDNICQTNSLLNLRGKDAPEDTEERQHEFSWPWFAGLIDGDGTIITSKFGRGSHLIIKPVIKISLANLKTIEYLSEKLGINSLSSGGGKGNKRKTRAIRLMSNSIFSIAPKIIPYLTLKKERAEIAYEIVCLRREIQNGQYNHPNVQKVKELIQKLDLLNHPR